MRPRSSPDRILLVRLREIGDVVFTTPAIAALRTRFPGAHLTYTVEPAAAPIVAGNPHLNDIIVIAPCIPLSEQRPPTRRTIGNGKLVDARRKSLR